MKNELCPPRDDLSAFVRCQVSEEQAESISEHVANCPQCEETVVGLEKSADTVFDRLKGIPASFPFQEEPELARMVQAVKQRLNLKPAVAEMTIREFFHGVARLGGFIGRKSDGDPGWQTLWRGWEKLQDLCWGLETLPVT